MVLKDGKGYIKEYNYDGKLLFEGEYLNGEFNGKGKQYNFINGNLQFEGEYLYGKINGKGKEYNLNGKLEFEGEYLNNFKIKGREYLNGKLEFEGKYFNNKKWNGKGYDENSKITYELINGNGHIKEYKDYILQFEGEFLNGKKMEKEKNIIIKVNQNLKENI